MPPKPEPMKRTPMKELNGGLGSDSEEGITMLNDFEKALVTASD